MLLLIKEELSKRDMSLLIIIHKQVGPRKEGCHSILQPEALFPKASNNKPKNKIKIIIKHNFRRYSSNFYFANNTMAFFFRGRVILVFAQYNFNKETDIQTPFYSAQTKLHICLWNTDSRNAAKKGKK